MAPKTGTHPPSELLPKGPDTIGWERLPARAGYLEEPHSGRGHEGRRQTCRRAFLALFLIVWVKILWLCKLDVAATLRVTVVRPSLRSRCWIWRSWDGWSLKDKRSRTQIHTDCFEQYLREMGLLCTEGNSLRSLSSLGKKNASKNRVVAFKFVFSVLMIPLSFYPWINNKVNKDCWRYMGWKLKSASQSVKESAG